MYGVADMTRNILLLAHLHWPLLPQLAPTLVPLESRTVFIPAALAPALY